MHQGSFNLHLGGGHVACWLESQHCEAQVFIAATDAPGDWRLSVGTATAAAALRNGTEDRVVK